MVSFIIGHRWRRIGHKPLYKNMLYGLFPAVIYASLWPLNVNNKWSDPYFCIYRLLDISISTKTSNLFQPSDAKSYCVSIWNTKRYDRLWKANWTIPKQSSCYIWIKSYSCISSYDYFYLIRIFWRVTIYRISISPYLFRGYWANDCSETYGVVVYDDTINILNLNLLQWTILAVLLNCMRGTALSAVG